MGANVLKAEEAPLPATVQEKSLPFVDQTQMTGGNQAYMYNWKYKHFFIIVYLSAA